MTAEKTPIRSLMADPIVALALLLGFVFGVYFGALWQRSPLTGPVTSEPPDYNEFK